MALLAVLLILPSCAEGGARPDLSITVGTTTNEVNALIWIAQERGYFEENDLQLTNTIYPSGVAALDGLLAGQVDLATGSEFAFVGEVLAQQPIRTLAVVSRSSIEYLVARVDRGIHTLADLKGKRVGVPIGSRPEFALDRYLFWNGLNTAGVTLVDVGVNRSVEALVSGQVDAVAAWQPYIDQLKERMGSQVIVWSVQEDQPSYTLVMAQAAWVGQNREAIDRFLKSLLEAERYAREQPQAVQALVRQKGGYTAAYVTSVWNDSDYGVVLDQGLVAAMEDQARWIIQRSPGADQETPNFAELIYVDSLEALAPEAVSIIH